MPSTPERQALVSSGAPDIRKAILERVIENGFITKIVFPKYNPDDFYDFEDQVYSALVSRQLEWLINDSKGMHQFKQSYERF
jgi:alkanesulfonate monooxygenase SsuD/methylene tetrahydromethanopterin reductase-like flavin-dependent oxidoreductase (luciferase family)